MKKMTTFLLFGVLFLLCGCNESEKIGGNGIPDISGFFDEEDSSLADIDDLESIHFPGGEWPDYIPAEIPELQGEISLVIENPKSHIRIFYDNATEDQIASYLLVLQEAGFQLDFFVYVDERYPDDSKERIQKGEYDAVDITKGEYHMRLEFGGNMATYDIYTSGFEAEAIAATTPQWPTELNDSIPPPERCELTRVDKMGSADFGYSIMCRPEDESVFEDYVMVLKEMGFYKHPNHMSFDESRLLTLIDGVMSVQIQSSISSELMLHIEKQAENAASALEWPQELEGLVPPPERCEIVDLFPGVDSVISCKPEDANVLQDYLSILRDLGFEEDNTFEGVDGQIISVTMVKMGTTIDLMISPESIMIHVK